MSVGEHLVSTTKRDYHSDPALIQACLAGDERAWEEVVERYSRLIFSVALRSGLSTTDADDVVQNVFAILLRRLGGLRDQTRLSSWLITTAHRESWRLSRSRLPVGAPDELIADPAAPPGEDVARWERDQTVREALNRIDERCRDLLTALFLEPDAPSYDEIGARLGMAVGSIGPTRARCFQKLEKVLSDLGVDGDD